MMAIRCSWWLTVTVSSPGLDVRLGLALPRCAAALKGCAGLTHENDSVAPGGGTVLQSSDGPWTV